MSDPDQRPREPRWRRPSWRALGALGVLVLVLAGVERGLERWRQGTHQLDGAAWIWARGVERGEQPAPVAFYAAVELELDAAPASARLAITADETYLAWLGGGWVGVGSYRPGGATEVYEVAELLAPGRNRLIVELRSSRGAGGLIAALEIDGRPALGTGASWRIYRRWHPDLWRRDAPLPAGEPPRVWGPPPVGRWRPGARAAPRPVLTSPSRSYAMIHPERGLRAEPGHRWARISQGVPFELSPRLIGPVTIFEWPGEVSGFPVLDLYGVASRPALLYRGRTRRELARAGAELIVPVPDANHWQSVRGEPFRYLRILGLALERSPFAIAFEPDRVPPSPITPWSGVFGMAPLWRTPRAEQEVLQRFAEERP